MPTYELRYAPHVWRLLNGGFCIYKPANKGFGNIRTALVLKLITELNSMETRRPREMIEIKGQLSNGEELCVQTVPNLADNPLVVGKRYSFGDLQLSLVNHPGWFASGVVVAFIGNSSFKATHFRSGNHLRVYEIKGKFGFATDNFKSDGKIVEKSTYKHIRRPHIDKVIAKIQGIQQTQMFKSAGVDLRSEEAYEMASKGMIRPAERKTPIVYGITLTDFKPPEFSMEVRCINEYEPYLAALVHEIAQQLRSSAMCTAIRLKRYGPFTIDHALLFKHWTAEHIIHNIQMCESLLKPHLITPLSPTLCNPNSMSDHEIFLETLKQNGDIVK